MALNGAEYDKIMQEYNLTRIKNMRKSDDRLYAIYDEIPRIREIDEIISTSSIKAAKDKIKGIEVDYELIKQNNETLRIERINILKEKGYGSDYLDPIYTCVKCKDTGYINETPCICLKQKVTENLYRESGIINLLDEENFDTFSYDFYSGELDGTHQYSPKENARNIVNKTQTFVDEFEMNNDNLLIRGETGLGKTFLSNCIAKALMDKGHTVLYVTANNLFEKIIADVVMNKDSNEKSKHLYKNVYEYELLIIDDLGTEFTNSFVSSQFFQCINTRLQNNKSTIISTNLSMKEISARYSERVTSRIVDNYKVFEFYGENIRYQKAVNKLQK